MKKSIFVLILLLFLVVTVSYVYSEFSLGNQASFTEMTINENYYLGYGLHWRGIMKPKLVNVRLLNEDGSLMDEFHKQVKVTPFIDNLKNIGALSEESFQEMTVTREVEFIPIKDAVFEANEWLSLMLRIKLNDENYENSVKAMVIDYRIFGLPKRQLINYDGFLSTNNH